MKNRNVEFKVIEDKRIVIATIKGIEYDPIRVFNKKFIAHSTSNIELSAWYDQKFMMPHSMKAVARCCPDDKFDIEKGKQIALKKLNEKYNCSLDKHMMHIANAMKKSLEKTESYMKVHKVI
jgi:hypothetical protein